MWQQIFSPTCPRNPLALLWLLFGNADDGPYGPGSSAARFDPINWRAAIRWWMRNPLHNVCFRLLAIEYTTAYLLYGTPLRRDRPFWPADTGIVLAINGGPGMSFKTAKWEGYAGWRPRSRDDGTHYGAFGLACRRRS